MFVFFGVFHVGHVIYLRRDVSTNQYSISLFHACFVGVKKSYNLRNFALKAGVPRGSFSLNGSLGHSSQVKNAQVP